MRGARRLGFVGLTALFVCALVAAGCGSSNNDKSTSTSASASATAKVDSAVQSCTTQADQLGGAVGAGLKTTCTTAGTTAKQAISSGSSNVKQALSQAATSCNASVAKVPAGQAKTALTNLCQAIASAAG